MDKTPTHFAGRIMVDPAFLYAITTAEPGRASIIAKASPGAYVDRAGQFTTEQIHANAQRLVSCWNACIGMEDPEAEIAALRQQVVSAQDRNVSLRKALGESITALRDNNCHFAAEIAETEQAMQDQRELDRSVLFYIKNSERWQRISLLMQQGYVTLDRFKDGTFIIDFNISDDPLNYWTGKTPEEAIDAVIIGDKGKPEGCGACGDACAHRADGCQVKADSPPLPDEKLSPVLAADHEGIRVDYTGMLKNVRLSLNQAGDSFGAFALHELENHMTELGQRYYSGDLKVVDEFLQLYCVERGLRAAIKAQAAMPRENWEWIGEFQGRQVFVDSKLYYRDTGKPADVIGCFNEMTTAIRENLTWEQPSPASQATTEPTRSPS